MGFQDFKRDFKIKISGFHPRFCISTDFKILLDLYNNYKCNSLRIAHNYAHGRRARLRMSTKKGAVTSNQKYRACAQLNYNTKPGYPGRPVLAPLKSKDLLGAWPSCSHVISGMNHV